MKYRIKFSKKSNMKFIGHLDLMRFFQKALIRACFPLEYSKGFNPHPSLSFAAPLSVGLESEGEYMDIDLVSDIDTDVFLSKINSNLCSGIEVKSIKKLEENEKTAMSLLAAADYRIKIKNCDFNLKDMWDDFYNKNDEIVIKKKTKKSEKEINIKPLIFLENVINDSEIECRLSQGSMDNLSPVLLISAFYEKINKTFLDTDVNITRLEMYKKDNDGNLVPL